MALLACYSVAVNLLDQIKDRLNQLQQAEATVARLRAEIDEARALLLIKAPQPLPQRNPAGTSTEMAEAVLRAHDKPLHVNDLISGIEREYQVSVRYATLVGNISRLVKKGKIFERTGPNRFGLLEWAVRREADALFGRELQEAEDSSA